MKMLPIGTQTFEKLRSDNAIYVDKTKHMLDLINAGSVYFLSRPRRFGKSLLISTFKQLFKGNKQLFEGLHIYDKWDWSKTYPVIHLDFAELDYSSSVELKDSLLDFINCSCIASNYDIKLSKSTLSSRFAELIEKLHESTGKQVVILVDEYDKPMIDNLSKSKEAYEEIKRTLHDFYQVIKASDEHLKFVFMTGVSRFSGLSVFSALNNLNDITMDNGYSAICGYTQEELEVNFKEYIERAGIENGKTKEETLSEIRRWYNGYSWDGETYVYNPFSTLLFFSKGRYVNYWFKTGTPTFLIEQIRKRDDLEPFINTETVEDSSFGNFDYNKIDNLSLLFQTGYLTIKRIEITDTDLLYSLDFPNLEVKKSFLTNLIEEYSNCQARQVSSLTRNLLKQIKEKDDKGLEESLRMLFANIPYDLHISKEAYYHSMVLMLMRVVGFEIDGEVHTDKGRIDAVLKKEKDVIVVEIKYSKEKSTEEMIEEAMNQIKDRRYYEKYSGNEVSLLAIAFGDKKEIACKFGQ